MRELMPNDIERLSEATKHDVSSVSEYNLASIPECIVETGGMFSIVLVNAPDKFQAMVVDGVSFEHSEIEVDGVLEKVINLISVHILERRVPLAAYHIPRQIRALLTVIYCPPQLFLASVGCRRDTFARCSE